MSVVVIVSSWCICWLPYCNDLWFSDSWIGIICTLHIQYLFCTFIMVSLQLLMLLEALKCSDSWIGHSGCGDLKNLDDEDKIMVKDPFLKNLFLLFITCIELGCILKVLSVLSLWVAALSAIEDMYVGWGIW